MTPAPTGYPTFARFAFPPNELGYCGPSDIEVLFNEQSSGQLATARAFDGAWPYLTALADATGHDPLDDEVVRSYWVGGPLLDRVDPVLLQQRLRVAFAEQVTGLLTRLPDGCAIAHHSFHVFVVYPWVRFLDRDPVTPLNVLQSCRIRWGTVDTVADDHATVVSRPLRYADGMLSLGASAVEKVRWRRDEIALAPAPRVGQTVAAHWDWLCGTLSDDEADALDSATRATIDMVNATRS